MWANSNPIFFFFLYFLNAGTLAVVYVGRFTSQVGLDAVVSLGVQLGFRVSVSLRILDMLNFNPFFASDLGCRDHPQSSKRSVAIIFPPFFTIRRILSSC